MKGILGLTIFGCILAALIVYPLYFRALAKFLDKLRYSEPEEWNRLGNPKLDGSLNVKNSFAVVKYLLMNSSGRISDPEVIKARGRAKFLLIIGLILFLIISLVGTIGGALVND